MDLDGDGIISMYELEYFYEEQQHRMESIGIETLPFEDCLCQMLDMIKPMVAGCVTLSDLKRCKMTPIFYDTFFNLEKYMEHEQRDPFASQREDDVCLTMDLLGPMDPNDPCPLPLYHFERSEKQYLNPFFGFAFFMQT